MLKIRFFFLSVLFTLISLKKNPPFQKKIFRRGLPLPSLLVIFLSCVCVIKLHLKNFRLQCKIFGAAKLYLPPPTHVGPWCAPLYRSSINPVKIIFIIRHNSYATILLAQYNTRQPRLSVQNRYFARNNIFMFFFSLPYDGWFYCFKLEIYSKPAAAVRSGINCTWIIIPYCSNSARAAVLHKGKGRDAVDAISRARCPVAPTVFAPVRCMSRRRQLRLAAVDGRVRARALASERTAVPQRISLRHGHAGSGKQTGLAVYVYEEIQMCVCVFG